MGIVDEDIARVRAATDFVALASEHLALRRVGTKWVGLCPFHVEKSPSFNVNAQEGLYFCFGCGARGDVITFVREIEHLDFVEAVEHLATRAGITLRYDDEATSRDHQRKSRIYETLERAITWYHDRLLSAPDAGAARHYLRSERGYDGDVVRTYRLGWSPDGWDQLLKSLRLPPGALVDAGLAYLNDRGQHLDFFRGRLLFPIFEPGGRPIGAGGRMLPGGRMPKYKNTTGTAVYDKSRVLYGLNWAKNAVVANDRVVVCEGYTDVIGLQRAGIGEAVATCGTALADGHIRLLTNFSRRIVLAYDADAAGQAAAERFYAWERRYEVDIRVAALPPGEDPADLARRDPGALQAAVRDARPFLAFQLERHLSRADLATAEGRVRAAGGAMTLVAAHPNELVRDQYLMEVADRCRIDPDRLRALPPTALEELRGRDGERPDARRQRAPRRGDGRWEQGSGDALRPVPNTPSDDEGGPGRGRPALLSVPGPELAALGLAVHRPADVAERVDRVLFAHPLARGVFDALAGATTLHEAIEAADPQVAELVQRLAVADPEESADDVMVRLLEVAGRRALVGLEAEMRAAPPGDQADYVASLGWLKLTIEALRPAGGRDPAASREAERRLVAWLVAREASVPDDSAVPDDVALPEGSTVARAVDGRG